MPATVTAKSAQTEARALVSAIRRGKRAVRRERKAVKEKVRRLEQLEATCREFGIELIVRDGDQPEAWIAKDARPSADTVTIAKDVQADLRVRYSHTQPSQGGAQRANEDSSTGEAA